ncbi:LPXTG cell wall anchor domain-containing protein [Secundilactobacillus odoratitofui]|nr:LPXTG cell wall anchor domain-containing protein [Secundilactobacillus odoratitofui]
MKQTTIAKRVLVSGAVLSGFLISGAIQAQASDGQTESSEASTATVSTTQTTSNSVTLQSSSSASSAVVNSETSGSSSVSETSAKSTTANQTTGQAANSQSTDSQPATSDKQFSESTKVSEAEKVTATVQSDTSTTNVPKTSEKSASTSQVSAAKSQTTPVAPTVSYKSARSVQTAVAASVVKADLNLTAENTEVQAGQSATFDLNLVVNGINQTMNQQRLVINLPEQFKLSNDLDLTIDGVTPTINQDGTQLIYQFTAPTNGLSISKQFVYSTADQVVLNGAKATMSAHYFDGDTQLADSGEQTVTVTSTAQYGVTNQVIGVLAHDENGDIAVDENGDSPIDKTKISGYAGDLMVYQVGISAPKNLVGQAYFEPGTPIKLSYLVPKGMTFVAVDNSTVKPTGYLNANGDPILVFSLEAPSLEDQLAATDNLFNQYFNIVLRINSDTPAFTSLSTLSQVEATSVNGEQITSATAESTIQVSKYYPSDYIPVNGTITYHYNWGPADGEGNLASGAGHVDPTVYSNAKLAFQMQTGPAEFYYEDGSDKGPDWGYFMIKKYVAVYNVDAHLNVDQMAISQPESWVLGDDTPIPFLVTPLMNIYVRYQDESEFEDTPILTNVTTTNGFIDMSQYVDNARGVAQIKFDYTVSPQGLTTAVKFIMSPKAGYYGTVSNDFTVDIAGTDPTGDFDAQEVLFSKKGAIIVGNLDGTPSSKTGEDVNQLDGTGYLVPDGSALDQREEYNQFMQPQTAEIVAPAENSPRVLNESLQLLNQTNDRATTGDNVLQVMVENNQASLQSFSGLKSYVFLPTGMTYTGTDANVTTTAVDNGTMLTINWAATALAPAQQNWLQLAVNIDPTLKVGSLTPVIYSTVTETDTVAPSNLDPTSTSPVQLLPDTSDIDGNAATENVFVLPQTFLLNSDSNEIHVAATATNQAGETGQLVKTAVGQKAQYGLSFTPTSDQGLQNVTIIGTLPAINDVSISDPTVARDTTVTVTMTGPVVLPADWQGLATVSYALKSAPDQYLAEAEVSNFSQVASFKITYTGDAYLPTDTTSLVVPVKVNSQALVAQTAYMSYSVAANGLNATEGLKAGLLVGYGTGQLDDGIHVMTKVQVPEGVAIKVQTPTTGVAIKTQVPVGVFVTPDKYYDNTVPPTNEGTSTDTPTGTPAETPTSTPETSVETTPPSISSGTDDNQTVTPITESDGDQVNQLTEPDKLNQQATANGVTIQSLISTPVEKDSTTTTLPQTSEQRSTIFSLIGLALLGALNLIGIRFKKHEH